MFYKKIKQMRNVRGGGRFSADRVASFATDSERGRAKRKSAIVNFLTMALHFK